MSTSALRLFAASALRASAITPIRGAPNLVIQDGNKYVFELTKCVVQIASYKPIGSRLSTPSI